MDRLRVLIVDDSLVIRAMIEEIIEKHPGSRVVGAASDIATARRMMEDLVPNVLTLDLAMPGTNGLNFLAELLERPHPPIVVVSSATTAYSEMEDAAIALGAYACFDKAHVVSRADQFVQVLKDAVMRRPRDVLPSLPPRPAKSN